MELKKVFENHIKIEPKVMAIETLFNNTRRLEKTDYDPPYQRNYVWDTEKATYFIESILLGTEIPPLIFFKNSKNIEVIDGRQRYQTILRYINNDFKLSKSGLNKLFHLENKHFKNLDKLKDLFWDTKLRIIEFSLQNSSELDESIEDKVKIEIFKRYNSGITPLKATEIDKAVFLDNNLNSYFKDSLRTDKVLFDKVANIFSYENPNIETLLKRIRILLVLHKMPIKRYAIQKDKAINKFYEFYSIQNTDTEIQEEFASFVQRINLLYRLKDKFELSNYKANRLQYECMYWAMQVFTVEGKSLDDLTDEKLSALAKYIIKNENSYLLPRSSFSRELVNRYSTTAKFFENEFNTNFEEYIKVTDQFIELDKDISRKRTVEDSSKKLENLRINKPEPSSVTIEDIARQMKRQRFLLRPPYQRSEVINKRKSSAIIESILLGIKIPPIFIYKRNDGVSEVLDGQQRLLSILGYIEESYLDKDNKMAKSEKNGYGLNLKNGILTDLHGVKFKKLTIDLRDKLLEYDLWFIEIDQKNNPDFDPIDLFIRLNYKPYPIKENTYEMWNSYIDRDITGKIKNVYILNKEWFYLRKNNSRMSNENIITGLSYLEYKFIESKRNNEEIEDYLDYYKIGDKINFRIKSKTDITKVLENSSKKIGFIRAIDSLRFDFMQKVKILAIIGDENESDLSKGFNEIFNIGSKRTQQSFYALWFFLTNIPLSASKERTIQLKNDLVELFILMQNIDEKNKFTSKVNEIWKKYEK